jgi:electron transfer flavoprotein alpha subunit
MSGKILVYIDQFQGAALPASWEVVSAAYALAEKLGGSVVALTLGATSQAVAEQAFQYGPEEVFYCDDPSLADYRAEPYTAVVVKAAQAQNAIALLFPTTSRGRELAAMCAVDLGGGVMPDATALDVADGKNGLRCPDSHHHDPPAGF